MIEPTKIEKTIIKILKNADKIQESYENTAMRIIDTLTYHLATRTCQTCDKLNKEGLCTSRFYCKNMGEAK